MVDRAGGLWRAADFDETERWLVRRGTPHLIEDYNAAEDIFTRAAPALTLVFLATMVGAGNLEWAWWQNALAIVGGFAVLLGIWAAANRVRDRPAMARPNTVRWPELVVFVTGPALVQFLFGQSTAAAGTFVALVALLLVMYVVTSYGLIPLTRWALGQTVAGVQAVFGLLLRALPLLLLVVTFLFINAEVWEVAGNLTGPYFAVGTGIFAAIGLVFLVTRLPAELERLAAFDGVDELTSLLAGTPVAAAPAAVVEAAVADPPRFGRRQRVNVLLVALVSQGLQVALVAVLIGGFFVLLGLVAVTPGTIENWSGHAGDDLVSFGLWGRDVVLTSELLRVAGFLAAFSSLHFTVTMLTDDRYRAEFFDGVMGELRQTLAVRAVYLADRRLAAGP